MDFWGFATKLSYFFVDNGNECLYLLAYIRTEVQQWRTLSQMNAQIAVHAKMSAL
jgi:hypothetical protein